MEIFEYIELIISNVMNELGVFAPILACFLLFVESILPVLPLALFITVNAYYLGSFIGFISSYIITCLGCYVSFKLCKTKLKRHFDSMLEKMDQKKLKRVMKRISKLKMEQLTTLIAIPFTPAFLVNIACGLSNIDKKKYVFSILIGKIFLIFFWQHVGLSLLESVKNPIVILKVGLMLLGAFVVSKIVNKKYRLE